MLVLPVAVALMAAQIQAAPASLPAPIASTPAPIASTPADSTQQIDFRSDPVLRFTVPVKIGGHTWRFLVDTGAEKSGISLELVRALGLATGAPSEVTGFAGSSMVPTVPLSVSGLLRGSKTLDALAFSRDAIGADGFLGLDALRGHIVAIDFMRQAIFIRRVSHAGGWFEESRDSIASMKVANDRMVFTSAAANGVRVQAILDTGSSISVGNNALKAELIRRGKYGTPIPIKILSVTGEQIAAEYVLMRNVTVGEVHISYLPIAFAGPEPFEQLGLDDRPALLLGMDVLRQFDRVEIDFPKSEVRFTARGMGGTMIRI